MMPVVSLNGFQARTNHADDLVLAATNQVGQRRSYATLVVGDQDAHTDQAASLSTAKIRRADALMRLSKQQCSYREEQSRRWNRARVTPDREGSELSAASLRPDWRVEKLLRKFSRAGGVASH